jgi:hypothetical protein
MITPESCIKTALAFHGGLALRLMGQEAAAANALAAFTATSDLILAGTFRQPSRDITETPEFQLMLTHHGNEDDITEGNALDYVRSLSSEQQLDIVKAFSHVVDDLIDTDVFPLENGKVTARSIIEALKSQLN